MGLCFLASGSLCAGMRALMSKAMGVQAVIADDLFYYFLEAIY